MRLLLSSCEDVLLQVLQHRQWGSKAPRVSSCKKKENPAKIVLLTQFWPSCSECTAEVSPLTELASCFTSANRRALMTRERLYLYKFDSVWKWKRCKHLLGKQNFRKQRWSFCPAVFREGRNVQVESLSDVPHICILPWFVLHTWQHCSWSREDAKLRKRRGAECKSHSKISSELCMKLWTIKLVQCRLSKRKIQVVDV